MYKVARPELFDAMPELGMGFHFGLVREPTGSRGGVQGVIVLNGEFALTRSDIANPDSFYRISILMPWIAERIRTIKAPRLVETAPVEPSDSVSAFMNSFGDVVAKTEAMQSREVLHSSPAFPIKTKANDAFVRFSAFANDRRIRPDGSLLPGTYVTSEGDAAFAQSGFAVVGRYALPNIMPATHRFDIVVPDGTIGLVGTVTPAFGQAGGGVEIEFTKGAPKGSVRSKSTISEY
jgi:hypothetical protein